MGNRVPKSEVKGFVTHNIELDNGVPALVHIRISYDIRESSFLNKFFIKNNWSRTMDTKDPRCIAALRDKILHTVPPECQGRDECVNALDRLANRSIAYKI